MTTCILSNNCLPISAEQANDLKVAEHALREALGRFEEIVERYPYDDELIHLAQGLARTTLRVEDGWMTHVLAEEFDDFDLSHLGELPRDSVGNCCSDSIDDIPVTGQGQRTARDLS